MIKGIDVSDVQGNINWLKVKSNIDFAFCKATDGTNYIQKKFKQNWLSMYEVGIIKGAYHYCHTSNDPIIEATHFVTTVKNNTITIKDTDMLVLDIEDDKNKLPPIQFIQWTLSFLDTVESLSKIKPIVYTGGPYFDKHGGKPSDNMIAQLSSYPLWLSAYTKNPEKYIPYVWKNKGFSIWQRSGDLAAKGENVFRCPGINGVVDLNQYEGTIDEFSALARNLHTPTIEDIKWIPIEVDTHSIYDDNSADKPL
jgi:lysozyme